MSSHPIQPIEKDHLGTHRFKENKIVRFLLDNNEKIDLNYLARQHFDDNEWSQFAQLIGYSFSGWSELSYVSDDEYDRAAELNEKLNEYVPNYNI